MERRDLIRRLGACLLVLAAAPVAAAGATVLRWSVVAQGATESTGGTAPLGYVAVTRTQERSFAPRLTLHDRAALQRIDLSSNGVVATFLYGLPCGSEARVDAVGRTARTVGVRVSYAPPPPGVGMCVRAASPYFLVTVPRRMLGRPASTHVPIVAVARA